MRILITGSSGFIGSNLVRHLLHKKDTALYGIDNMPSGDGTGNYTHIQADIAKAGWTDLLPPGVDTVVHLAQSKRYKDFPDGAEDMKAVNIDAMFAILEWAKMNKVKRFIFASTGSVYRATGGPLTENDGCDPLSMYAATKLSAETILKQYERFFEVIILRLFSVYGPGQRTMLIPSLIEKVRSGKKIELAGGKGVYLSPLFISDCVDFIGRFLDFHMQNRMEIFNLAGDDVTDLGEVVSYIGKYLGRAPDVEATEGDPVYMAGSNKKACSVLGLNPSVGFKEGIKRTIEADRK